MRLFTLYTILSLLFCLPALGQTANYFDPPTQVISAVQSTELQVALEAFNLRTEEIPTVFQAANLASRLTLISSISSGNWNSPTSWNCACVPTSIDDVTIETG
ncbi:MAG TPA: hypothetical protein EYN64_03490, partial [Flavobacteriales bacterium]|nr:hypothetical protein [Flavobacteriales bacterium]